RRSRGGPTHHQHPVHRSHRYLPHLIPSRKQLASVLYVDSAASMREDESRNDFPAVKACPMSSPSPPAGQLLFAVLAMNTNFVKRDHFLEAVTDWLRQPQTPLPDLLSRRAKLDEEERVTLGRLLNKCAKRHGGAQQALDTLLDPYLRYDLDALLGKGKPNQ